MDGFKFNTGILSPIHSDISLNDTSSFGSLPGTPDLNKQIESSKYESTERDCNIDSYCKRTMEESAVAFDMVVNDIKKQSTINTEKEEKYKKSYEMIKHSMDKLFYKKASHSSVLSPISNETDLENVFLEENNTFEITTDKIGNTAQNVKVLKKTESIKSKTHSQVSSRKSGVSNSREEEDKDIFKNIPSLKESKENSKQHKNKKDTKRSNAVLQFQNSTVSKMVSTATQTSEQFEVDRTDKENLKNFYTHKQRKVAVSNSTPAVENKSLSLEKSIEIAVGMEMDNMRRFILDQNLCLRKELLKLQETTRKQKEVTEYLFSVIEELLQENKNLVSKNSKKN